MTMIGWQMGWIVYKTALRIVGVFSDNKCGVLVEYVNGDIEFYLLLIEQVD